MIKRQSTFRLLTNYFCTQNHHLHRHHCKPPLIMAYIAPNDHFFKGFHDLTHPIAPSSASIAPSFIRSNSVFIDSNSSSGKLGFRGGSLMVKGCADSLEPVRALAAPKTQLVREFESRFEDNSSLTARYVSGHGTCQGGTPLDFTDYPLTANIVVAVDVDEVLGNFVSALNRFIADRYSSNHSLAEYYVYEFCKIWKCSRSEANIRVHEFFETPYFKSGIYPLPGAQKALHKLSRHCKLSVVTSRQNVIKDHTIKWIEKHYPGVFNEIHFGNHFALNGESRPKSEICRSLGATILIDDNPRYAIECAEVGIKVLLFDYENSYPWCKTDSVHEHPLVTKVHNWEQVEQQISSWIS